VVVLVVVLVVLVVLVVAAAVVVVAVVEDTHALASQAQTRAFFNVWGEWANITDLHHGVKLVRVH
jgi:hypothetical protein